MLRTILNWIGILYCFFMFYVLVQFALAPAPTLPLLIYATTGLMLFGLLELVSSFGALFLKKNFHFPASSLAMVLWFGFLNFANIYPIFLTQKVLYGREFLLIISVLSTVMLLTYLYQTIQKIFPARRRVRIQPYLIISSSFALTIFVGAILLFLPLAKSATAKPVALIDAFFVSTSAVCVTGLSTIDISSVLSMFGQTVLVILVQVGGLGIMTFTAFFTALTGEKMSLSGKTTTQNAVGANSFSSLSHFVSSIIKSTLIIEMIGMALLFPVFIKTMPLADALFYSVFHGINGFCNAGFSLFPDSFIRYQDNILLNVTIMALIIFGGIGFSVIQNLYRRLRGQDKRLTLHTKLVLSASGLLILVGAVVFFILEKDNLLRGLPIQNEILASFFASVTARTAGFNTVDYGQATAATLFFTSILMFIGASPGSTGGGIKITTFVVILLNTLNTMKDKLVVTVFKREIPFDIVRKSLVVFFLSLIWLLMAALLLMVTEKFTMSQLIFEATSAFGTVGLSTGITGSLSPAGKIILILTMFFGRVGPMTIVFSLGIEPVKLLVRHPEEKIIAG